MGLRGAASRWIQGDVRSANLIRNVTVQDHGSGQTIDAIVPGDYIYPSDLRLDGPNDLLYVKAEGLAGGFTHQTWLFQYDLAKKRLTERRKVKNGSAGGECPDPYVKIPAR